MAVMTAMQKTSDLKNQDIMTKKHSKCHRKTRPITATLDHPLILDIKLLKKLDMTTFTKKGLIALSKFCGISLINKTDNNKKTNKCIKTIPYSKKQSENEFNDLPEPYRNRSKRKIGKQSLRTKPRIRFKMPKEDTSPDEDSLDVVCKNHEKNSKISYGKNKRTFFQKSTKTSVTNNKIENAIPEPCKTCDRTEHPERLHSHPKILTRSEAKKKSDKKNLEEKLRDLLTTKDTDEGETEESLCTKESEDESFQSCEEQFENSTSEKVPLPKSLSKSSSSEMSTPETGSKKKLKNVPKPLSALTSNNKQTVQSLKKPNSKVEPSQKENGKIVSEDEELKYVTGCYVCGSPVTSKLRIKHEKTCIAKWRAQNNLISPDKRQPEPRRPDYRFTATGELDCEGTFESIWANHMDSLVPCKICGRKFFPDRIEKHENCCNNLPINVKYNKN